MSDHTTDHVSASALARAIRQADPALSRFEPLDRIVVFDDFDRGLGGWSELIGNYSGSLDTPAGGPYSAVEMDMRPPMLSSMSMWDVGTVGAVNGTYSMKVATRPQAGHVAHPVKRISILRRSLLREEVWFTFKAEATTLDLSSGTEESFGLGSQGAGDTALHSFGFGYDIQDDTVRHWPGIRYLHAVDGQLVERWQYHAGGVRHPHLDGWVDIPGGAQPLPYNEIPTKHNWMYLSWTVDLETREYVEMRCNDLYLDMRGLRHEYKNVHEGEDYPPYEFEPGAVPGTKPRIWGLLNLNAFVQTNTDRRVFLYLDSLVLSTDSIEPHDATP